MDLHPCCAKIGAKHLLGTIRVYAVISIDVRTPLLSLDAKGCKCLIMLIMHAWLSDLREWTDDVSEAC